MVNDQVMGGHIKAAPLSVNAFVAAVHALLAHGIVSG
jgi:hypothetical protein